MSRPIARICLEAPSKFRPSIIPRQPRRWLSQNVDFSRVYENDIVILKDTENVDVTPILTHPLTPEGAIHTHRGVFAHKDIIGHGLRDKVISTTRKKLRIFFPTLAEYVTLSPRRVTPIYPGEANLIVSLLDIHPHLHSDPPLQILEAGTGHGSLTLHLARAIHASNATPQHLQSHESAAEAKTNAVLHTLDIHAPNSQAAQKLVQGFRRGQYASDVRFHVGTVEKWIAKMHELQKTRQPFLHYVILDLPRAHEVLKPVADATFVDATLAVYCPSITQIVECVHTIKRDRLPFFLDQVVELGAGSSGGRPWDVRLVVPRDRKNGMTRATSKQQSGTPLDQAIDSDQKLHNNAGDLDLPLASLDGVHYEADKQSHKDSSPISAEGSEFEVVCRPMFGVRSVAGGFLGIWKRTKLLDVSDQCAEPVDKA